MIGREPEQGRRSSRRRFGVLFAAASLSAAACNPAPDVDTSPVAPETSSTSAPTSSTSTSPTSTTTDPKSPDDEVVTAWNAYWEGWVTVRASENFDPAPLEQLAEPDIVEAAVSLFERLGPAATELVTHPRVIDIELDRASLEDCVVMAPSWAEVAGIWYRAELTRRGESWVVADLQASISGCVPAEAADAAIAGYEAYYDAESEFWEPADPNHPLLDQVLAEPQRSFIIGLLEEDAARGAVQRGQPTNHPEVIQVLSPTVLLIESCQEPALDFGLYDVATGERLPDEPPVREGQRDLESAVMVFEDGQWKVSELRGLIDSTCEFAPTNRGLRSV